MTFTTWIEDSGESLENLKSDTILEKFNKVFGFDLEPNFYFNRGYETISDMRHDCPIIEGIFPITKKPIRLHFEWDSYFETDDYDTSQYLNIFHEVWAGSGEAGWLDELLWLVEKLTVCGERSK